MTHLENLKILVIHDDIFVTNTLKLHLPRIGVFYNNIRFAQIPSEAFILLKEFSPDVIITGFYLHEIENLNVYEVNGIDFIKKIKKNKSYKTTQVIFCTWNPSIKDLCKENNLMALFLPVNHYDKELKTVINQAITEINWLLYEN